MKQRLGRIHCVIPDVQDRPDVTKDHLRWIGNYIAEKQPDVIVQIGDFADMVSLNGYTVGQAAAEGTRYSEDVKSTKQAMNQLTTPIRKCRRYDPAMHLTLGNHEHRITREAQSNPRLIGTISVDDLCYRDFGWKVHPFLSVARIDGIEYSHYFVSGSMGRPVSSAAALLRTRQQSCVMGHVQRIDIAVHPYTQRIALFSGICYQHDEDYLGPQGNNTKRGIWMLNEVQNGTFDPMFVSLGFLKKRYS
jgi:hypothetical protein